MMLNITLIYTLYDLRGRFVRQRNLVIIISSEINENVEKTNYFRLKFASVAKKKWRFLLSLISVEKKN